MKLELKLNKHTVATYNGSVEDLIKIEPKVGAWVSNAVEIMLDSSKPKYKSHENICKFNVQGWEIWFDTIEVNP